MLVNELHNGQGLGNQLWSYVVTRILAQKQGFDFGIQKPEKFKGMDFLTLDFGKQVFGGKGFEGKPPFELPKGIQHYYVERKMTLPNGDDVRIFDNNLLHLCDNTKIDGLFQDSEFIAPYKEEIKTWLRVRPEKECHDYSADTICVINFRGGGYALDKKFFLPKKYWDDAVRHMRKIRSDFRFVVVTDDVLTAKKFFPDFEVNHWDIAKDYVVIKNAHYLILSNSSFAQFPAFTSDTLKYCIAPKYWTRHNTSDGYWSLGYNITPGFNYLDRNGNISDYETCKKEFGAYLETHKHLIVTETEFDFTKNYVAPRNITPKRTSSIKATVFRFRSKAITIGRQIANSKFFEFLIMSLRERKTIRGWNTLHDIEAYRKTIRIYDVFTFFNELDILEIRLNILDPYVDYFVLVESPFTYSGKPSPLHYSLHKDRFKKWNHKILHYVVKDVPNNEDDLRSRFHDASQKSLQELLTIQFTLQSHTVGNPELHWFREFYMKESARKALADLDDNDICYISDVDEIWNPELVIDYSKDDVFKPIQKPYMYFLNNRTNEDWRGWTGTIVTKFKNIRNSSINNLRTHRIMLHRYSFLRNGGWHFTFQGGYDGAKRKIEETNHPWYQPKESLLNLSKRITYNHDIKGRNIQLWVEEKGLPKHILENKNKYSKLLK